MATVISIEDVSKLYRLGEIGTGSLAHDVNRWWCKALGKEDPYLQVGQSNDRSTKGDSDYVYAIRDVSFDVRQGEALGIIGLNGAGKSTLLKILSRVTTPTSGQIKVKGRIASLLEVGTGFHPELTGRENIYLNGAILGMRKTEIRAKFDEIVDFSGCDRYIDTPVKRYSSGMYVRLAFAVAAHLDPEILIVDEVLAVGDAQFQTKCLGKMKDVAGEGRTVLFVSHNMSAVKSLTNRAILMHHGMVAGDGPVEETYSQYIGMATSLNENNSHIRGKGKHASITSVKLISESGDETGNYIPSTQFILEIEILTDGTSGMSIEIFLKDANKTRIAMASLHQFQGLSLPTTPGLYTCRLKLGRMALAGGDYSLDMATSRVNIGWDHQANDVISFAVMPTNPNGRPWEFLFSGGYGSLAWLTEEIPEFKASANS